MKSIRAYLATILVATICIVNFVAALNGYRNSTLFADEVLDQRLSRIATSISELDIVTLNSALLSGDAIYQVWESGKLVSSSKNASSEKLVELRKGMHLVNRDSVQWRANVIHIKENRWVIYGERYDSYRKLIDKLVVESILPIIWVLPIIALLVWLITGYGLRPLKDLAESLFRRDEHDLSRMSLTNYPKELSQVTDSINGLFERLESAFESEKRFSANAAHELRTPVAVLKVSLHNHIQAMGKSIQSTSEANFEDFSELTDSVARMQQSIEQILALHELTPENMRRTIANCELVSLTQEVFLSIYASLQAKEIDFELKGEPLMIKADGNAISVMVKNLLENAIKYTPTQGRIELTIKSDNHNAVVIIEDSGPGIPENDYARVFDRFYRVSHERSDIRTTGSGLGLSIVKHVLDLHRGDIALSRSSKLGGLHVKVSLPVSQAPNLGENNV